MYEIIIINNDPYSELPDWIILPENCVYLLQPKPGSYAARNLGILKSKGNILAFTDADCIPCTNWIEKSVIGLNRGANRIAGKVEITFDNSKFNPL